MICNRIFRIWLRDYHAARELPNTLSAAELAAAYAEGADPTHVAFLNDDGAIVVRATLVAAVGGDPDTYYN